MTCNESVDTPGKIIVCGPYHGYVQYSIWGPGSDDPEDVTVSVEDNLSRLVIEIRP